VSRRQIDHPLGLLFSLVLGAVGLSLFILGVGTPDGWLLIVIGVVEIVVSLIALFMILGTRPEFPPRPPGHGKPLDPGGS
jgi:hypothetical protein